MNPPVHHHSEEDEGPGLHWGTIISAIMGAIISAAAVSFVSDYVRGAQLEIRASSLESRDKEILERLSQIDIGGTRMIPSLQNNINQIQQELNSRQNYINQTAVLQTEVKTLQDESERRRTVVARAEAAMIQLAILIQRVDSIAERQDRFSEALDQLYRDQTAIVRAMKEPVTLSPPINLRRSKEK